MKDKSTTQSSSH
jgi:hypothetical protein